MKKIINKFQYRKRYGLHAMIKLGTVYLSATSFNTASGMDCMQYQNEKGLTGS